MSSHPRIPLIQDFMIPLIERATSPAVSRGLPTINVLASGKSDTDGTSFTTASFVPNPDQPLLMAVANLRVTTVNTPTVTGNGLTWVQAVSQPISTTRRLTWFIAAGPAPTEGEATIHFVDTQSSAIWWIGQIVDADESGGALVQSANAEYAISTGGTLSFDDPPEHENNLILAAIMSRKSVTGIEPGAGYTELFEDASTFTNMAIHWGRGLQDCSPTWASETAAIAMLEIKAA